MKKKLTGIFFLLALAGTVRAENKDSLGLPGDNLSLQAVLELFKTSKNPEEFEKKLNAQSGKVNNLDLNGDRKVDYIRVIDHKSKDAHAIVLQVPVNKNESQDVAVIEIEKQGENTARLQIIGDAALYGKDYIVEPKAASDKPAEKNTEKQESRWQDFNSNYNYNYAVSAQGVVFVNVWSWPCVSYVYYPAYVVWVSPWYWAYWPVWWDPWVPYPYAVYYGWWSPYYVNYIYVYDYSMTQAHQIYAPRRQTSESVAERYRGDHGRYEERQRAEAQRRQDGEQGSGRGAPGQTPTTGERKDQQRQPTAEPRQGTEPTPARTGGRIPNTPRPEVPPRVEPRPTSRPGGMPPGGGVPAPRPSNPRPR